MKKAQIISTGSYLPEEVLTNEKLETMVDTSNEWIVTRTGIQERRIASKEEFASNMGAVAAKRALKKADLEAKDIDCIIVGTLTPDYIFPSTACLIQEMLGAKNAAAFDVQAACSGYIYALSMAKAFVESKQYKNVLLIATEKLSSIVDYEDRSTCVLFGDGAAACIVSMEKPGLEIDSICLGCDGSQSDLLILPGGGSRNPATKETVEKKLHYIRMAGSEVFKHAVLRMEASCKECLEKSGVSEEEISWLIPHQANVRIIDAIAKRFKHLPKKRIYKTVHKYGNTSCSSVGIALDELLSEETLQDKDPLLLTAFGAGLTWGSCLLKYKGSFS